MNVLQTVKNQCVKARSVNLHCVSVFWISPFETLENRVGYFEESAEAEIFKNDLSKTYRNKCTYSIYMDGILVESGDEGVNLDQSEV